MAVMQMVFDGEFISAESGEELTYSSKVRHEIAQMVARMKDGDAITINARMEESQL